MTTKTKIVKCPTCRGKKRIMTLGFSLKDCHECKAIGYVEEPVDEIAYLEAKEYEIPSVIRQVVGAHQAAVELKDENVSRETCAEENEIPSSITDGILEVKDDVIKKRGRKKKVA